MTEKSMNIINIILYYVVAPLLVLEFILSDLGIIKYTVMLFAVSAGVLIVLAGISYFYKRKHPDYEFKANDLYTKIVFLIILMECLYTAGFFKW